MQWIQDLNHKLEDEYINLSHFYPCALLFGILSYFSLFHLHTPTNILVITTVISVISVAILFMLREHQLLCKFITCLLLSFCAGILVTYWQINSISHIPLKQGGYSTITGVVESTKPNPRGGQQIVITVLKPKKHLTLNKVRVNMATKEKTEKIFAGDTIRFRAYLMPPPQASVPGGYDFAFHSFFRGIGATGYMVKQPKILRTSSQQNSYSHNIRKKIYNRLHEIMQKDNASIAAALMIGESGGIKKNILDNMRYSGISHILCVSGLHLSLVAAICLLSFRVILNFSNFLAYNINIKIVSGVAALTCSFIYLMLTGQQIAATRAFIMTSFMIIAFSIGRDSYPMRSLAMAATFILCLHPEYALHPSFQLSFIAVISLISGFELFQKHQHKIKKPIGGIFSKIQLFVMSNLYSSFIASIATAPIVIYHFHIVSNYTLIANLLAIPLMTFYLMPLVLLSAILMPFNLDAPILHLLDFGIAKLANIANWVTSMPHPIWYFGHISNISLILFCTGFLWLSLWHSRIRLYGFLPIILSAILMLNTTSPTLLFNNRDNIFAIHKNGQLKIYGNKISRYIRNYWSGWFGIKQAKFTKQDITQYNHCINTGSYKIAILYNQSQETYCNANLVLIAAPNIKYPGQNVINYNQLQDYGTVAVYCNNTGCSIETSNL